MKKISIISIIFLILTLLFALIFLVNTIHLVILKDYTFILCLILFILIFFGYSLLFTFIIFTNNIVIFSKFKKETIRYNELIKIQVKTSVKHAFLVGATIEIIFITKNMDNKKFFIGQIIFYKKIIKRIRELCLKKCIKFELNEE